MIHIFPPMINIPDCYIIKTQPCFFFLFLPINFIKPKSLSCFILEREIWIGCFQWTMTLATIFGRRRRRRSWASIHLPPPPPCPTRRWWIAAHQNGLSSGSSKKPPALVPPLHLLLSHLQWHHPRHLRTKTMSSRSRMRICLLLISIPVRRWIWSRRRCLAPHLRRIFPLMLKSIKPSSKVALIWLVQQSHWLA